MDLGTLFSDPGRKHPAKGQILNMVSASKSNPAAEVGLRGGPGGPGGSGGPRGARWASGGAWGEWGWGLGPIIGPVSLSGLYFLPRPVGAAWQNARLRM